MSEMKEVKRYTDQEIFDCLDIHHMCRGPYVLASAYDALLSEKAALVAERDELLVSLGKQILARARVDAAHMERLDKCPTCHGNPSFQEIIDGGPCLTCAALAGHALDGMNGKHAVCGISALLKDADTLIEEWTGILQANDLRNSAIDGDAWRVRFAALAGNEGKGK